MARLRAPNAPPTHGRGGRATPSSAPATARGALVRISDLARQAGVPSATIKHYMREGLLPRPTARTSRNMAYYDPRLAAQVRTIKDLQTRRFLPLRLIGDLLEPAPSAEVRADAEATLRRHLGELAPATRARRGRADRGDRAEELVARCAITADELTGLAEAGLAGPGADGRYRDADLELIEIIDETRRLGLGDLFPMPILVPYAEAVRALVRTELELFRRQVLAGPALPPRPLDQIAREATALGERLVVAMRAKLVLSELQAPARPNPAAAAAAPPAVHRASPAPVSRTRRTR